MPDSSDLSPSAPPPAVAVVGLSGGAMRYAEVRSDASGPRLRRLGTCDFDLDAEDAVFGAGSPDAFETVLGALGDVFAGTEAQTLVVVASPTATTTFFTPLPAAMTEAARDEQLRQEAALLADVPPATPVRVRAVPVRAEATDEGERRWYHVVHVGEHVHARLGRMASTLGVAGYDIADAGRAATAVARALDPDDGRLDLVVGAGAGHTEAVVARGGSILFGHHGPGRTPEDTAYFALAALDAVGLDTSGVGRLWAYGEAAGQAGRMEMLSHLTGLTPEPLNALSLFGQPVGGASAWELAAFAPLLGAALGSRTGA